MAVTTEIGHVVDKFHALSVWDYSHTLNKHIRIASGSGAFNIIEMIVAVAASTVLTKEVREKGVLNISPVGTVLGLFWVSS